MTINNPQQAQSGPTKLLRLESLVWFIVSVYAYYQFQGTWTLFLVAFLVPDLSIAAYLLGPKVGAIAYNLMHIEVWPALLACYGFFFGMPTLVLLGLIWLAHIHLDRMLGFGLKYSDAFKHTHLGNLLIGKN
ncbi:MAG: DUF4260 domain-containing protein [Chlamydiales bacterium]|nr:DUF4260 domain-containing protein [Chlamydiales bacterium]